MAFTNRQRNIVNPFPEEYGSADVAGPWSSGRSGVNYQYESPRNLWVLEGIHDSIINFGIFPQIGKRLELSGPIDETNNVITIPDAMAYAAMFPQNATVDRSPAAILDVIHNPAMGVSTPYGLMLVTPSAQESQNILTRLVEQLKESGELYKFISGTILESYEDGKNTKDDNGNLTLEALTYRLIEIPFFSSTERRKRIRDSFGLVSLKQNSNNFLESITERSAVPNYPQSPSLNFSDWTQNITADQPSSVTYYNPRNSRYYYLERTNNRTPAAYDNAEALLSPNSDSAANISTFQRRALKNILSFAGINPKEASESLVDAAIIKTRYGDAYRPMPPAGLGVWLLNCSIDGNTVNLIDESAPLPTDENLHPSPVAVAKNIISHLKPVNTISKSYGKYKQDIAKTTYLLDFYSQQLNSQGIAPDDLNGLNLDSEAERLQFFFDDMKNLFAFYSIDESDEDLIDLRLSENFGLEYMIYNGSFLISYMGKDIKTLKDLPPRMDTEENPSAITFSENVLKSQSPTSYSYIFHSGKIAQEATRDDPSSSRAWTEFLPLYTYPNPNQNSFRAGLLGTEETWNPQKKKADVTALDRKFRLWDREKTHKTMREKEYIRIGKTQIKGTDLYLTVRSSLASCDTAQAKLLNDAMKLYSAITGKTSVRNMIAQSISLIRNNLIADKEAQAYLQDAEAFTRNPSLITKRIETEINQEFNCILDIIGDATEFVLSPLSPTGLVKPIRQLTTQTINKGATSLTRESKNTAMGVDIPRKKVSGIMDIYKVALRKIIEQAIKQFILSIFRDVVSAALGCSPPEKNDTDQKFIGNFSSSYGVVRINEIIDSQGNIDIVSLAEELGIQNQAIENLGTEEEEIILTPPRPNQLRQMNSDVSSILTQEEAYSLLAGYASGRTLGVILEMVYEGKFDMRGLSDEQKNNSIFMRSHQESFRPNDIRYATLDLTDSKIASFYQRIGDQVPDLETALSNFDPEEVYCNLKDPKNLIPDDYGISKEQLDAQIEESVLIAKEKLDSLCEAYLLPFASLNEYLSALSTSLDPPQWYQDLLRLLAQFSNDTLGAALASILGGAATTPAASQRLSTNLEDYELYNSLVELLGESVKPAARQVIVNNGEVLSWEIGTGDTGLVSFSFTDKDMVFYEGSGASRQVLFTAPLAETNDPCLNLRGTYSARDLSYVTGRPKNDVPIALENYVGAPNVLVQLSVNSSHQIPYLVNNYRQTNVSALAGFFIREAGSFSASRNLRAFNEAILKSPFAQNGDKCLTEQEEKIAVAAMEGIHTRLVNFYLNIGYLLDRYWGWNAPDSLEAIATYLAVKFKKDMVQKNMFGLYVEAFPLIRKAYSLPESTTRPSNVAFDMVSELDESPNDATLKYIIKQQFLSMLVNLAKSDYNKYGKELFNPFTIKSRWDGVDHSTAGVIGVSTVTPDNYRDSDFYQFVLNEIGGMTPLRVALFQSDRNDAATDVENPDTFIRNYMYYYLPVPIITALIAIYNDKNVDTMKRISSFRFYSSRRVALADDALLSAVNLTHVRLFSSPFDGYPVDIAGTRYYTPEDVQERVDSLETQRLRLMQLQGIIMIPAAIRDDDWLDRSFSQNADTDVLATMDETKSRDFFNDIYGNGSIERMHATFTNTQIRNAQRNGLRYAYVADLPGDGAGELDTIRKKAWYERFRLTALAKNNSDSYSEWAGKNKTLLKSYIQGDDILTMTEDTDLGVMMISPGRLLNDPDQPGPNTPMGIDGDGSVIKFSDFLILARNYAVNESAFVPDTDIREDLEEKLSPLVTNLMASIGWAALSAGLASLAIAGGVVAGAYISTIGIVGAAMSVQALSALAVAAGATATATTAGAGVAAATTAASWGSVFAAAGTTIASATVVIAVVVVIIAVIAGSIMWWLRYNPEDPKKTDAVKAFSDDYRPIPLVVSQVPSDFPVKEVRPLEFEDDLIDCANYLPDHDNTMDKVAILQLYYELSWKTQKYGSKTDTNDSYSELNQLRTYLKMPPLDTLFWPKYAPLESELPPNNFKVFNSLGDVRNVIAEIQSKTIFSYRERVAELQSSIASTVSQIATAAGIVNQLTDNDAILGPIMEQIVDNATDFATAHRYEEKNDALYLADRSSTYIDIIAYRVAGLLATTSIEFGARKSIEIELKIMLAANLTVGGGNNPSLFGYMDTLQELYEEISAALPYGYRLHDGENYQTKLDKVERDLLVLVELIGELTEGLESLDTQPKKILPDQIFGARDEC